MTEDRPPLPPTPPGRPELPHLSGDLPTMLEPGPAFATAMRGYDRLQVDNYVAWAENELRAARRVTAELVDRLAESESERYRARALLTASARDRDLVPLADRVAGLLRLAAEEAAATAQVSGAQAAQAEDVVARARDEAELVVRRARHMEARAAGRLQEAERRIAEARAAEERTRTRVQALLAEAVDEQERLEAAGVARRADTEREVQELQHRRALLHRLLDEQLRRVDAALEVLDGAPAGFAFDANRADARPPAPAERPAR